MLTDLILHAVAQPAYTYNGVRKIVQGIFWETDELPNPDNLMESLGYGTNKLNHLKKSYYSPHEIGRVRDKLKQREKQGHTSVTLLMRNEEKGSRSQGYCMTAMHISRQRTRRTTVDITYRSTETIRKFTADFALIHEVLNDLEVVPETFRFYFANMYVSCLYIPSLYYYLDPIKYMEHVRKHDKKFFSQVTKATSLYVSPTNASNYLEQRRQWVHMQNYVLPHLNRDRIDKYLLKHLGQEHEAHMP